MNEQPKMNLRVVLGSREYNLGDPEDLRLASKILTPPNWPTAASDCVAVFAATVEMLQVQLKRHLAKNWPKICKQAQENLVEEEDGTVKVSFGFELDQSVPNIATIGTNSLSFSLSHNTTGSPVSHDIAQGDWIEDLASETEIGAEDPPPPPETSPETQPLPLGDGTPASEPEPSAASPETAAEPPPQDPPDEGGASVAGETSAGQNVPTEPAQTIVPIPGEPNSVDKPKRRRKKK